VFGPCGRGAKADRPRPWTRTSLTAPHRATPRVAATVAVELQPTLRWPPKDGQPALRRTVRRWQNSDDCQVAQLGCHTARRIELPETVAVEWQPMVRWPPKDGQPAQRFEVRRRKDSNEAWEPRSFASSGFALLNE